MGMGFSGAPAQPIHGEENVQLRMLRFELTDKGLVRPIFMHNFRNLLVIGFSDRDALTIRYDLDLKLYKINNQLMQIQGVLAEVAAYSKGAGVHT